METVIIWEETLVTIIEEVHSPFRCSESTIEPLKCALCGLETFLTTELHHHHSLGGSPLKNYICTNCGFNTYSKLLLFRHFKSSCPSSRINYMIWYCCKRCLFKTKARETLKLHEGYHEYHTKSVPEPVHKCPMCPYESSDFFNLQYHTRMQHGACKFYLCKCCDYKSKKLGHLNRHIASRHRSADDVKWYKCDQCPYKAKQNANLKRHLLQHLDAADIEWFRCDFCKHKTKNKYSMRLHVRRRHLIEDLGDEYSKGIYTYSKRVYACEKCSYKSTRHAHLMDHFRAKHPEKNFSQFECAQCGFKTFWKRVLRAHMNRHFRSEK